MMTDIIENMTREELVDKCTNQRIEIRNLLNNINSYVSMSGDRGVAIRQAVKHLKSNRPTVALSTLQGFVHRGHDDAIKCLRELANGQE